MINKNWLAMSMALAVAVSIGNTASAKGEAERAERPARVEAPRAAPARVEAPRETYHAPAPRVETPRAEAPRYTPPPARVEPARVTPAPARVEPARVTTPARVEPAHNETRPATPARVEPARVEPARVEPTRTPASRPEVRTVATPRQVDVKQSVTQQNKNYSNFFDKSQPVKVTPTKNGGHVEQQGNKYVSVGSDGKIKHVTEPVYGTDGKQSGSIKRNASNQIVESKNTTMNANNQRVQTHEIYSHGKPVITSSTVEVKKGLELRNYQNNRSNYRYEEKIKGNSIERTVYRNNVKIVNNYNIYNYRGHYYPSYHYSNYRAGFFAGLLIGTIVASAYYESQWAPYYGYYWAPPVYSVCWGWCWAPRPYYNYGWQWTGDYVARSYYDEQQQEIAAALQDAADARAEAGQAEADAAQAQADAAAARAAAEEISQQVAVQAKQQLESVNSTGDGVPLVTQNGGGILNDPNYIFFVDEAKSVTDQDGEPCDLSHADTLKMAQLQNSLPADQQDSVYFKVLTARAGDCRAGTVIVMPMSDAQDFVNEFNSRVDQSKTAAPTNVQLKN